jgi:hypothetical protein
MRLYTQCVNNGTVVRETTVRAEEILKDQFYVTLETTVRGSEETTLSQSGCEFRTAAAGLEVLTSGFACTRYDTLFKLPSYGNGGWAVFRSDFSFAQALRPLTKMVTSGYCHPNSPENLLEVLKRLSLRQEFVKVGADINGVRHDLCLLRKPNPRFRYCTGEAALFVVVKRQHALPENLLLALNGEESRANERHRLLAQYFPFYESV